jgi:hypothetical protein
MDALVLPISYMIMLIKLFIEKLERNVKLSPCLINRQLTKTYGGTGSIATSALDGEAWSASRHGRFIPEEIVSGTHWMAGLPRAGLEAVGKRNIYCPVRNQT